MKSWVDRCVENDDIWLVLVFHGVDGVGWEARTGEELDEYFQYMKDRENDLWVATFRDVAKYIRERMNGDVSSLASRKKIVVNLTHSLDPDLYDLGLTLKTIIPDKWKSVSVTQNGKELDFEIGSDQTGRFIIYQAMPNQADVVISRQN